MYYYFDPTYILVLIGIAICGLASANVSSTFNRYAKVLSASGLTGAETARRILEANGIYDVTIQRVSGNLTDHYNPSTKTVNLSESTYDRTSVAAVGVAAHECGHVIQHHTNYAPINFRTALVGPANLGSKLSWPLILIGLILGGAGTSGTEIGMILVNIGILLFCLAVLFQIVTLPVEFNASSRALVQLETLGILGHDEKKKAKKVLKAAALTYVAAVASSLLQLLRLILIARRRD